MVQTNPNPITIAESTLNTIVLDVAGMKCAGCVGAVEKQLLAQIGVKSACVNLLTGVAAISAEVETVTGIALAEQLTKSGFPTQYSIAATASARAKIRRSI
jgi:P-type Cu2+ transporter